MLELVELPGLRGAQAHQLSGGQQQRVALARALINHPQVLLLDEPLGALDLKLRKQMQLELKRIQTEVGITFIYVTHDQEEAMTMSDRIAVMRAGQIEQLGDPEEPVRAAADARSWPASWASPTCSRARWSATTAAMIAIRLTDGTVIQAPCHGATARRRSASASGPRSCGWSPSTTGRPGARDLNAVEGTVLRLELHRGQHPVPGRDPRRTQDDRLLPEPRDRQRGGGPGRWPEGPPHLAAPATRSSSADGTEHTPGDPHATGGRRRPGCLTERSQIEIAIERALRQDRISRRNFLRAVGERRRGAGGL